MTKQELREIREKAIQVLYVVDLLNEDLEDIYRKQDIFSLEIK